MPKPEKCSCCKRERTPAEAATYGSRCEDCYCYNIREDHAAEMSHVAQVYAKHHQPELRLDNQISNKLTLGMDDEQSDDGDCDE